MPSINKAFLLGHVGHTPKLSQTRSGQQATRVSLATSQTIYRADGTKEQRTEWHNVVAYGRLAENVCAYVQKGNLLWVEGELHMREYVTRDGIQKQLTEVIATSVQFFKNEPVR